jgi:outer membrane protein assembly factor BamD (BamD/ComL family)
MSPKKGKVTKHMMKEDKLVTTTFKFTEFVQKHSREFLIPGAGLVVVVLVVLFLVSSNKSRNQKAAELLGKARVELESGEFQAATTDLQNIWRSYTGTNAAQEALYLLGNSYYYGKDYDQALRYFQEFVSRYQKADPLLLSGAYSGIGDCHVQKKEYGQAAESYLQAASKIKDDLVIPGLLLSAAQAYSYANQPDKAQELYERIITKYPNSKVVAQARLELAEISSQKG